MRRRLTWLLGVLGIAGLIAYLKRRRRKEPERAPDAHAAELRRTLQETREQAAPPAEPTPQSAGEQTDDEGQLQTRRQDVHERGRSALDEMGPSGE